jgi:hypothetical protein
VTFRGVLNELRKEVNAVNPLQPIASAVLDMTGADSIWSKMVEMNMSVHCLSHPPEEYTLILTSTGFPDNEIQEMCWQLTANCGYAEKGDDGILMIRQTIMPTVDNKPVYVRRQVYAVHTLLENL